MSSQKNEQDPKDQTSIRSIWGKELEQSSESLDGSIAVIIDVLATTSNVADFLAASPRALYLVNQSTLRDVRKVYSDALVVGDIKDLGLSGTTVFPSNVPSALEEMELLSKVPGQVILYMTNNGTVVTRAALERKASQVVMCGFTNFGKVAEYLLRQSSQPIALLPTGERTFTDWRVGEDRICAETLSKQIQGEPLDWTMVERQVRASVMSQYPPYYLAAGRTMEQLNRDLDLVLRFNSQQLIPLCTLQPNGLIHVTTAE